MDQNSIKIYILNVLTLVMSFTNLEITLKIVLLIISIIYTSMKIYDWITNKIKGKDANNYKEDL